MVVVWTPEMTPKKSTLLTGKSILVTGGTGSFGQAFVRHVLEAYEPERIIVFSRDELKQFHMAQELSPEKHPALRYFLGDVRDRNRLHRALDGVDIVVHAAALKQVPAAEYNPTEAIQTNILGAMNLVEIAIDRGVSRIVALSTDKAANPINLYGATKLCSDKLFVAGNNYAGRHKTRFAVVRYGNVMGSRGSVIPFFLERRKTGVLPITDERMTRFSIMLTQGVQFVLESLEMTQGGELFVPKIPSYRITDVAKALAPECKTTVVGIRPGEKLHEVMVPEDSSHHTMELRDRFVILPEGSAEHEKRYREMGGVVCDPGFSYRSDNNPDFLSVQQLRDLMKHFSSP